MITLVLETSTEAGGVALFRDEAIAFRETFTADRSHSSDLFTVIERALAGGVRPDRIIAGLGPGSYAGVRIAIAAAIGLSISTGSELIGIPSIVALEEGEYLALGDARRGGFALSHIRDGAMAAGPEILTREELDARLAATSLPLYTSDPLGWEGVETRFPQVERLGRLGVQGRGIHSRGTLEPLYLREPSITLPKTIDHCGSKADDSQKPGAPRREPAPPSSQL